MMLLLFLPSLCSPFSVNTASRMESNGTKGRIHCSQATADELILSGKSSWLITREDKVTAKGKGEMQTYWIDASRGKAKSTSQTSGISSWESLDDDKVL